MNIQTQLDLTPRNVTKKVVSFVARMGTTAITYRIIANNLQEEDVDSKTRKVCIVAGSWALGGAVGMAAQSFTDAKVDDFFDALEEFKAGWQEYKKDSQTK